MGVGGGAGRGGGVGGGGAGQWMGWGGRVSCWFKANPASVKCSYSW